MRTRRLLALAAALPLATTAAAYAAVPTAVVSQHAVACTPQIAAGQAYVAGAIREPSTVYQGGTASTVLTCDGRTVPRGNTLAYNGRTGALLPWHADTNGPVTAMVLSGDGRSVYLGGRFTTVNGTTTGGLAKVDAVTGAVATGFAPRQGGQVYALAFTGGRVLAGGTFGLLALNPTTGADTGAVQVTLDGNVDGGGVAGPTRVDRIGVNPAGTVAVILGPWLTVNGQPRRQAAMLALTPTAATLLPWHPARFDAACVFPYYLRSVAWDPAGAYFVLTATGAYGGTAGFCDAIGRWNAGDQSGTPAWVNFTGGDSPYSSVVGRGVVYIGGHLRWLNNPNGSDYAGPGSYPSAESGQTLESMGAIDTTTGLAIDWRCLGCTRGHGKEWLGLASFGLVAASDGRLVNNTPHFGTAVWPSP